MVCFGILLYGGDYPWADNFSAWRKNAPVALVEFGDGLKVLATAASVFKPINTASFDPAHLVVSEEEVEALADFCLTRGITGSQPRWWMGDS